VGAIAGEVLTQGELADPERAHDEATMSAAVPPVMKPTTSPTAPAKIATSETGRPPNGLGALAIGGQRARAPLALLFGRDRLTLRLCSRRVERTARGAASLVRFFRLDFWRPRRAESKAAPPRR